MEKETYLVVVNYDDKVEDVMLRMYDGGRQNYSPSRCDFFPVGITGKRNREILLFQTKEIIETSKIKKFFDEMKMRPIYTKELLALLEKHPCLQDRTVVAVNDENSVAFSCKHQGYRCFYKKLYKQVPPGSWFGGTR